MPRTLGSSRVAGVKFVPFAGAPVAAPALLVWNPALQNPALASFLQSAAKTARRKGAGARR
ncbi:hypothetical protein [Ramlibacter montanisoli]|uniref:hypothetical protein n=1 Tax=Ramlibacter montanisoli TaxID=2732512 RepID=UPI002814BF8F|nr:hypothetical protein [Ramlibacter montanisoli]